MNEQKQQNGNRPQAQNNQPRQNGGAPNNVRKEETKLPRPAEQQLLTAGEPAGQKYVSIAIIAFLIGFGAAALWFSDDMTGKTSSTASSTPTGEEVSTGEETDVVDIDTVTIPAVTEQALSIENQKSGITVTVSSVTLAEPAWLAVTESVEGGVRILGAQLFDRGTTEGGKIELLRGTLAGRPYDVVIRNDNGDHAFDPKLDSPVLNAQGMPLSASFVALEQ